MPLEVPLVRKALLVAVAEDFRYVEHLIQAGVVHSPALEVGSRAWQGDAGNFSRLLSRHNVEWSGCDITSGDGVDFQLDITDPAACERLAGRWRTVLMLNILEHVYDPILALRNAMTLLSPRGVCVIITPTVWHLHDYPKDFWRPLPDFYLEFAARERAQVVPGSMSWLVGGQRVDVDQLRVGAQKALPSYAVGAEIWGRRKWSKSRLIHRVFNTIGRLTPFPLSGIGVAIAKGP